MLSSEPRFAVLSISAPVMGRVDTVHPVLLWDDRDAVLIDTGFPRQLHQLRASIEASGVDPDRINRIILTHQDIDHIGNLQEWTEQAATPPEVSAHAAEIPFIQGERRLLRFTDEAIASLDRLPDSVPASFREGLKALMLQPPRAQVDRTLIAGERLPWCGGIVVIGTPGHTPGHISLYHEPTRTLIAGDALEARENGAWLGVNFETALDPAAAKAAVRSLSDFDCERLVCYHGGEYRGNARERIAELSHRNPL